MRGILSRRLTTLLLALGLVGGVGVMGPVLVSGQGAALASGDDDGADHDAGDDHGSDDHGSDDHDDAESDDGPDHDLGDDNGGQQAGSAGSGSARDNVIHVEISRSGIEVSYPDGTSEEIDRGRYERKDAAGNTIEERVATQADVDRLNAIR